MGGSGGCVCVQKGSLGLELEVKVRGERTFCLYSFSPPLALYFQTVSEILREILQRCLLSLISCNTLYQIIADFTVHSL